MTISKRNSVHELKIKRYSIQYTSTHVPFFIQETALHSYILPRSWECDNGQRNSTDVCGEAVINIAGSGRT